MTKRQVKQKLKSLRHKYIVHDAGWTLKWAASMWWTYLGFAFSGLECAVTIYGNELPGPLWARVSIVCFIFFASGVSRLIQQRRST